MIGSRRQLQSLVRLRQMRMTEAMTELAEASDRLERFESQLLSLEESIAITRRSVSESLEKSGPVDVELIRVMQSHDRWYVQEKERLSTELAGAKGKVNEATDRLREVNARKNSVDRLCDRNLDRERTDQSQKQQRNLDSQGLVRSVMHMLTRAKE